MVRLWSLWTCRTIKHPLLENRGHPFLLLPHCAWQLTCTVKSVLYVLEVGKHVENSKERKNRFEENHKISSVLSLHTELSSFR